MKLLPNKHSKDPKAQMLEEQGSHVRFFDFSVPVAGSLATDNLTTILKKNITNSTGHSTFCNKNNQIFIQLSVERVSLTGLCCIKMKF